MQKSHIEYPKLKRIPGTNIAYILTPCAVNFKNGFDKYIDYLASKTNGAVKADSAEHHRTLREYCYKLYKINGLTLEELEEKIKANKAELVGDMFFSTGNQIFETDDNGNLLLKSYGSDLENIGLDGGDVLLDSDGDVLRSTKGHMFIRQVDAFGNYPCDVFVAKGEFMSDNVKIVRIDYNFLNKDGKLIRKQNFERTTTPTMHEVERTYSYKDDDKVFVDSSKSIYPKSYVFDPGKGNGGFPMFFPSATALLIENRNRIEEGKSPIVQDETPYLVDYYKRISQISSIQVKLTQKYQRGSLSPKAYRKAMHEIAEEEMLSRIFSTEMETKADRKIESAVALGEFEDIME